MLLPFPRSRTGASAGRLVVQEEDLSPFEAGLRRDLAAGLVLAHESAIGGWRKRFADLVIVILLMPFWALALALVEGVARLRGLSPHYKSEPRVGYGGRRFSCWRLCLSPPSADIVPLHAPAEAQAANDAAPEFPSLGELAERLPQLLNVLRGDMSLVGPRPLVGDEIAKLTKGGKKFYLSTRPGVFSLSDIDAEAPLSLQHKDYAMSWSLASDAALFWEVVRGALRRALAYS
ncbi:MAG TPA: sugar transferase [Caulobacterales bacterium]|nr:sugar transferase [Caulobacterales bacterium]